MVQVQPFDFGNTLKQQNLANRATDLRQLALGQQQQQSQQQFELQSRRQALSEEQHRVAAQRLGLEEQEYQNKVLSEVIARSPDRESAVAYGSGVLGIPAEIFSQIPDQMFGQEAKLNQRKQEIELTKAENASRKADLDERRLALDEKKFEDGPQVDPKDEAALRKEFTALSKDYMKQVDAFGRVSASAEDPSAAGDLALIFNYMKVLDPGSTVREGEFATAQNSGGVDDSIRAAYNRVRAGQRLSKEQRADFVDRAERLFDQATVQHEGIREQFLSIAEKQGFDPANVVIQLNNLGERSEGSKSFTSSGGITFTVED